MLAFAARRLTTAIPTLLVIIVASFLLMRTAPGGPFDAERALAPEVRAGLERAYGLDAPLHDQLGRYLAGLARGDFGPSLVYRDFNVADLIAEGLPVSLTLGALALVVALVLGVPIGAWAAYRRGSGVDRAVQAATVTGVVVPTFVTAPLLVLVFGLWLGWLPVSGWGDGAAANLVLPVAALSLPTAAAVARLTRGAMIATLAQDFIRTARAKGLAPSAILRRHALRPALLPVVSYLGPAAAGLLTGSVVVETVFALPGLGRYFVQGALNRDYPLVLGVVVLYAALVILFNLAADLAYGLLDPRTRKR
jgi:oligopeptide transport system permease protein